MTRSWGKVTLAGTSAVPLFGDVTTAAFIPPAASTGIGKLTVASTTRYRAGDRIILNVATSPQYVVMVDTIASATVLNVRAEGNAVIPALATSNVIALSIACYEITVQGIDGNTASLWIGADSTVTNAGGGSAIFQIAKVAASSQPNSKTWSAYMGADCIQTNSKWIAGAASDAYVVSCEVN
jgi:hypothetical protein